MARKKKRTLADKFWGLSRISLGLIFFWAFIDKLIGLGFSTCRGEDNVINTFCDSAWLSGGSPTEGFLKFGTKGPFADFFQGMAGNGFIDVLFMIGLLGIGLALILGMGVKIAGYSGAILMFMMYLASAIWPEHHPFIDDHIVYAFVLLGLTQVNERQAFGFGDWWKKQEIVQKYPSLE